MTVKIKIKDFYLLIHTPYPTPTACHIRFIRPSTCSPMVVISEIKNNPGASVTNAMEFIMQALKATLPEKGIAVKEVDATTWIEHYNDAVVYGDEACDRFASAIREHKGLKFFSLNMGDISKSLRLPFEIFTPPEERLIAPEHILKAAKTKTKNSVSPSCRFVTLTDNGGEVMEDLF